MNTSVFARGCQAVVGGAVAGGVLVVCQGLGAPGDEPHPHVRLIQEHFERFNEHDAAGVAALATDDVAWYSIEGDQIITNSEGADGLVTGLEQYFGAIPTVRARLEHVHAKGSFAMAREVVSWSTPQGERRAQASFSCYQIHEGKVRAVWYFPAEAEAEGEAAEGGP